ARRDGGSAREAREVRAAAAAAERRDGEDRAGAGRGAEEEGTGMSKVLIVAEHDGKSLNPSTAKCVTCAHGIPGAEITVAVFAKDASAVAAQAAKLQNVARVVKVENAANEHALAAVLAPQIVELAAGYSHVFGPSTTFGKDLMPRVAALLDTSQ